MVREVAGVLAQAPDLAPEAKRLLLGEGLHDFTIYNHPSL